MNASAVLIVAILILAGSLAAATMPRLIHAALSLVAAFVGLAALFFLLGAEFVGLVQIFVYVGSVAVLVVFTILLTRRSANERDPFNWLGTIVALAVFAGLLWAVFKTTTIWSAPPVISALTVKQIGSALMTQYLWPLQCVGVILTAAMIGALILVMEEKE